ncbi:MAG: non-canonical purine NTP pyrophosphatase [Patescibacteria group bacterium]
MDKIDRITFITGNAGKAKYLADFFHMPVDHVALDLPEIQSLDLETIVRDKAARAYEAVEKSVLVEDVSLSCEGFGGLPGPLIKWFLEAVGREGICRFLDGRDRSAVARVCYAFADDNGIQIFTGSVSGTIVDVPRGESGFGWDPIFVPKGATKTFAEMTPDEKHATSMRREALEKMKQFFKI